MCKIHRIRCSVNTLKISENRITEFIVIFKKIGKCYGMRFFLSGIFRLNWPAFSSFAVWRIARYEILQHDFPRVCNCHVVMHRIVIMALPKPWKPSDDRFPSLLFLLPSS